MIKPEIRRATKSDAAFLVPLVDRASEGLSSHIWGALAEPGKVPKALGLSAFKVKTLEFPTPTRGSLRSRAAR